LRPGIARTCWALTTHTARAAPGSVSTLNTGFQYTPVDSSAAWVQPAPTNQPRSAPNSPVVVPNVRVSLVRTPAVTLRTRQATTVALCTSNPAQHG